MTAGSIDWATALATQWGLQGCLPLSSTIDFAAAAIRLIVAGGTYLPHARSVIKDTTSLIPRERVPKKAESESAVLTPREQAVLDLLERGLPNKAIAHELNLSLGTVKVHVHNIMAKFQVRNRTAAALASRAMQRGRQPSGLSAK